MSTRSLQDPAAATHPDGGTQHTMSLVEKVSLLSGQDFWSTRAVPGAGIPSVVLTDGPHGVRKQAGDFDHIGLSSSVPATCFPPAVAVGSSWDPEVARAIGAAVGREARASGVHVVLGPGVNIKRSPLCGRNFEYYSEDPLLSGVLGVAHVQGQQAQGVGASVKHFAVNNQETDRMRVSADVDDRTLREIYLPAFERVVTEAAPVTVMSAYNKVNGVPASENRWLLTDLLRGEWGFTGAVVSDWGAVDDPVAALAAGLDLQMPGPAPVEPILDAVWNGTVSEAVVDTAVARVLALAATTTDAAPAMPFEPDAHHRLARELATRCAVLLKNDGDVLPLAPGQRLAVLGAFAATPRFQGGGSSRVAPTRTDTALAEIQVLARGHGCTVEHSPGFGLHSADLTGTAELREAALVVAGRCDVAVVFAGLGEDQESEGFDRTHLDLPREQVELIRAVTAAAPRTVVVLSHGGVVSLEGWVDDVDTVLDGFLLGQASGGAIADLLFGVANPSGRLAETIPRRLADTASHLNFPGEQGHVRHGEGVMVGYRWHETADIPARYPFGHGLSYTTFDVDEVDVRITSADTATVSARVTNVGDRAGGHVLQVYVATDAGPVRRPVRELRAFATAHLEPGESRVVELRLDRRSFAYWDVDQDGWRVAPGDHRVQVCRDAATVLTEVELTLVGDRDDRLLDLDATVQEWLEHPIVGPALLARVPDLVPAGASDPAEVLRLVESMPMRKVAAMLGGSKATEVLTGLLDLDHGR